MAAKKKLARCPHRRAGSDWLGRERRMPLGLVDIERLAATL
jgi:hypothetical protein